MTDIEAIHPLADRLSDYVLGRLDGPEMDEIEQHLSGCDSCCRWIRDRPEDSLVAKLRGRSAATVASPVTDEESVVGPPSGFEVPSSFILGPDARDTLHDSARVATPPDGATAFVGLPGELNDHPRYRVVAAIGSGGMGTVYRAEHRLMDRPVALKVIRGDLLGNEALVERFRREVKSAARLVSHPNIVAAYDAEQAGETHMLVMEFVEGTDLARLVDRRGPLPVGEACEYVRQAALGLQHAFEDGMVHRDIKPQNLMRTNRGQIKILDFGLARFASEVGTDAGMTAEGMVLGSADYIAPEQIDDPHAADIRADIYSLGCTLYFLLAGRPPFPDRSLIQKLMAHREKTARPLAEIRGDVPPGLARAVGRMMARDPSRRFQSPDDVARALAPFADSQAARTAESASDGARTLPAASPSLDSTVGDRKPSGQATRPRPGSRRPRVLIATALAVLATVAGFLTLITYRIQTGTGELVIETDDPDIEVIVKRGGQQVTIVNPKTKDRIELGAGRYELQLAGGGAGLRLSPDTFTLRRGDKTVVTVRRPLPEPASRPGPQPHHEHHEIVLTSPKAMDVIVTQPYVGQVRSQGHIDVRTPENGHLREISVKEGQAVKQGDLMFKIAPALYQAKLDAEMADAKIAELELSNVEKLAKQEPPIVSQYEVKLFEAKLAKAQAKVKQAEAESKFTGVKAPFDGIVARLLHERPGGLVKEGDILSTLSDNSVIWVYFNVPEEQYLEYMAARKLHEKEYKIELELANHNEFPQAGKIGAIEARFNNKTGNIPFRADFPNPDGLLRHGQTGTILIRRKLHDAIVIPRRATYELMDKRYVYVVDKDDVVHRREILIRHELNDIFVIKKGVGVGDRIILEGIRQVRDGEKVEYDHRPYEVMEIQTDQPATPAQPVAAKPPQVARVEPRPADAISHRTRAILAALDEPVPMNFANETTLGDVLTYIKETTWKGRKPTDPGIPIYVDPDGLREAGQTLTSTVRMDVIGSSLKATLPLLLGELGLGYIVKDDVLIVSSTKGIDRERDETASPAADASPETKLVLAALDEPISMPFAGGSTLGDVVSYIKQATATPGTDGISIFVNPVGLRETGRSMDSTMNMYLEGVPLKSSLRLLLKQIGLAYRVKDGVLIIGSAEGSRKPKARADGEGPPALGP